SPPWAGDWAGSWAGVLVTSANAVRALAGRGDVSELAGLIGLPVVAVGQGSAEAARQAGFVDVTSADGDAADLVRRAAARFAGARHPLLYLAGTHRAADVAAALSPHGIKVHTVAVYEARPALHLPGPVRDALEQG